MPDSRTRHCPPAASTWWPHTTPALRHSPGRDAQRALLAAVAPGGTLLVVHHADVDAEKAKSFGFDITDYLSHDDVLLASRRRA